MNLFCHRQGDPSLPPLLLLHSGGMTHREWQPQFDALAQAFYVLAPDLPGHGNSRLNGEPVSISGYARAIVELLQREHIERAHLVGSSTGAAIALYIALHYPDIIAKLVLYRMGYCKDAQAFKETQQIASPEYWQSHGMAKWMSNQHLGQTDDPSRAPEAWKQVIARVSQLFDPETTEHSHRLTDLQAVTAATLLIAGDRDPLVPMTTVLEMATAIPDTAVWIIPKASHVTATNTWRAASFTTELMRFLN